MDKHVILYRDDGIDSRIVVKEFDSRGIKYIPIESSWPPDSLPIVRRGSEMIRGLVGILAYLDDLKAMPSTVEALEAIK